MSQPTYVSAAVVTPSDTATIPRTAGLLIGSMTAGATLTVVMAGDGKATVQFQKLAAGTLLPISVQQVKATGTLASGIVALR